MRAALSSGLILTVILSGSASAQMRAEAGQLLAQQWCSGCHQVAVDAPATDMAPPFASLANDRSEDLSWVRARLQNPPYPMLGINLSRAQIEDIVTYFESLQH